MRVRKANESDWTAMWPIMRTVIQSEDALVLTASTGEADGKAYWFGPGVSSCVSEDNGEITGMFKIQENQPGLGNHVANASFMVDPALHGRGIGRSLAISCLREASEMGFLAMQFNFVVSTNEPAVNLWKSLGFEIIGTGPSAFRHKRLGLVDVFVMHRFL